MKSGAVSDLDTQLTLKSADQTIASSDIEVSGALPSLLCQTSPLVFELTGTATDLHFVFCIEEVFSSNPG